MYRKLVQDAQEIMLIIAEEILIAEIILMAEEILILLAEEIIVESLNAFSRNFLAESFNDQKTIELTVLKFAFQVI